MLKFDLITPEKAFFSAFINQVEIPGTEGEFGVLEGHAPLISTVGMGLVKIHTLKDGIKSLFVAGGIAEVNSESCSVLAEKVVDMEGITKIEAEKTLVLAKEKYDSLFDEDAKRHAEAEVKVAEAIVGLLH